MLHQTEIYFVRKSFVTYFSMYRMIQSVRIDKNFNLAKFITDSSKKQTFVNEAVYISADQIYFSWQNVTLQ